LLFFLGKKIFLRPVLTTISSKPYFTSTSMSLRILPILSMVLLKSIYGHVDVKGILELAD
jgi:hypothetical protein